MANEFGSQYALYQITITKMSGSDDSKTYWTYRRYSDFHDIDIRLREVLGESDFPLELPKKEEFGRHRSGFQINSRFGLFSGCGFVNFSKTLFRDLKNEFLQQRAELLNDYLGMGCLLLIDHRL